MSADGRCKCGSRIFIHRQVVITQSDGTVRDIPSVMLLECVTCRLMYTTSSDIGPKTLTQFVASIDSERYLFQRALEDWKNTNTPEDKGFGGVQERNDSYIVIDDADRKDFARLGVEALQK